MVQWPRSNRCAIVLEVSLRITSSATMFREGGHSAHPFANNSATKQQMRVSCFPRVVATRDSFSGRSHNLTEILLTQTLRWHCLLFQLCSFQRLSTCRQLTHLDTAMSESSSFPHSLRISSVLATKHSGCVLRTMNTLIDEVVPLPRCEFVQTCHQFGFRNCSSSR